MPRVLLLLPTTTYRATDFLEAARATGVELRIGSDVPQTVGEAAERSLTVPFDDPTAAVERIVEAHRTASLDAVLAVDDRGVVVASEAAAVLGLPHNPPEAVRATRDKLRMREALHAAGVAQPAFAPLPPLGRGRALGTVGLPAVVKPRQLSGSRGVLRVDHASDLGATELRVRSILADAGERPDEPVLVEEFVPGPEVAIEAILRGGDLDVLAVFDKPDPLEGPTFEETIYVTPSRHEPDLVAAARDVVRAGTAALGLREGPVHAEVRLGPGGARLIEVAARSIGGLCARSLRFGLGVSLEEVILRHAAGLTAPIELPEHAASGVMMLPIPRGGVLREVHGRDRALAVEGVWGVEITVPPGRDVVPLPEGDRYLGFLFARGPTPEAVERSLREGAAALDVEIDDSVARGRP